MLRFLPLALVAVFLTGCAGFQVQPDENVVAKRAEQRMTALKDLDFKKAYSYMTPGYRAVKNLNRFQAEFAGAANLQSFAVVGTECEEDRCVVILERSYQMHMNVRGARGAQVFEGHTRQVWVRLDGQWWYSRTTVQ